MQTAAKILLFLSSLLLAGPTVSQELNNQEKILHEVKGEIKSIISDQIAAFSALDVERAYYHASNSIKSIFPNSKVFGDMVRQSYPMIWNPKSYEFLAISGDTKNILQRVLFIDQKGSMHFFDYALKKTGRRWVISGVYGVQGKKGA